MSDGSDVVYTVDQVAACNTALRTVLGKPPEHFTQAQFVGMISDEIEQLRGQGWSDAAIASLIAESTDSVMDAAAVSAHYAPPELRRRS